MKGEFSRLTFDPRRHFAGLLQQQGRVGSDADWNEWVEAALYRLKTEATDVIGGCGRPKDHPGFGINIIGPGTANPSIQLTAGRLYAGGILAEMEQPVNFPQQIDWPIPTQAVWSALFPHGPAWPGLDFSTLAAGSTRSDLFYAEVWLRHLTSLNDEAGRDQAFSDAGGKPDWNSRPEVGDFIRERALGGPDTCTRLQTVAQVKLWNAVGKTDCPSACTALQTARPLGTSGALQVNVTPTPPVQKPCDTPLTGGFGGAENRTYRVEIHDPGKAGTATFKWSNENGAFTVRVNATALTSIPDHHDIVLQSIGHDQTTQLRQNDWVELCGEETELGMWRNSLAQLLNDAAAQPDGTWTIQLTKSVIVPHAPFLRRWSAGTQTIALGSAFNLDAGSGLSVTFFSDTNAGTDVAKSYFHEMDYWIWAARTGTRDVEPPDLANTPQQPRGIERHYCCLTLVTWTATASPGGGVAIGGTSDDCPNLFPPLTETTTGCCTVTVGDGEDSLGEFTDIQQAIDSLGGEGGVVCLGRGVFPVTATIQLDASKRNVIIRGMGPSTQIIFNPDPLSTSKIFMRVSNTDHVTVEGFFVAAVSAEALISIESSNSCTVRNCTLVNLNFQNLAEGAILDPSQNGKAIRLSGLCTDCAIEASQLLAAKGAVTGSVRNLLFRENQVLPVQGSVFVHALATGLEVVHNQLLGLGPDDLKKLQAFTSLSSENIDIFQKLVATTFLSGISSINLERQAVGVYINYGFEVIVSNNLIVSKVGILSPFLGGAHFEANLIGGLIGVLSHAAFLVRVADNQVLASLGLLPAGIVEGLCVDGNTFGGIGIVLISLDILAFLLEILKLPPSFGGTGAVGLASVLKIYHNILGLGIVKNSDVMSADLAIVENTVSGSSSSILPVGILLFSQPLQQWPGGGLPPNPRHLIQGNALEVHGEGSDGAIFSACDFTTIRDNNIVCDSSGIKVQAPSCTVSDNVLSGTAATARGSLIMVGNKSDGLNITGNRLMGGPGNGIDITSNVSDMIIEGNMMRATEVGISTGGLLRRVSISRNDIQESRQYALALWEGQDIQINHNTFSANGQDPNIFTIQLALVTGAALVGNLVVNNTGQGILAGFQGEIRVQGNTVRDNRGMALQLQGQGPAQRVLLQNNYVACVENPGHTLIATTATDGHIEFVNFEGNQCFYTPLNQNARAVLLAAADQLVVNGNTIKTLATLGGALEIVGSGLPNTNAIVTSNLISGPSSVSSGITGIQNVVENSNLLL